MRIQAITLTEATSHTLTAANKPYRKKIEVSKYFFYEINLSDKTSKISFLKLKPEKYHQR